MLVTATESNFAAGDRSVGLGPNRGGSLLSQTSPVPIIRLPGITLANFASRHVEQWFHISRAKLCYRSQFLPPSQVAITLDYRYLVPSSLATPMRGILQNEQTPGSTSHNHIWVTV